MMPKNRPETDFAPLMGQTARALLGEPNADLSKSTELRFGNHGSIAVDLKKGTFYDHENQVGGGVLDLVVRVKGGTHVDAVQWLQQQGILPKLNGRGRAGCKPARLTVAEFGYLDETGNTVFVTERQDSQNPDGSFVLSKDGKREKTFTQKRPDPRRPGEWIYDKKGCRVIPYRLPELIEAVANEQLILIVEGEAKVDLLRSMGVNATCCAGGAGKWNSEHSEFLRGGDVVLVPDADAAGFNHIQQVGGSLSGIAKRVRVLMLPDLPPKGDIIDWSKAGGTREQLDKLIEAAPPWKALDLKSEAKEKEDALIASLAKMEQGLEFARKRKEAAKELDVNIGDIDAAVQRHREENAAPLLGHWEVEPWPEPVEGDSLLRDIIRRLKRHVVFRSDDEPLTIALWVMFSWVHDEAAVYSPILVVTSAEPESGKTTTLGVMAFLMPRCLATVEITSAALYRSIKRWQPSFAIDEFDKVLSEGNSALRTIMNSGHTRQQIVIRCDEDNSHTPEAFLIFAPKAIGMIGRDLPPATASRGIFIQQERKKGNEPAEKFAHQDDPGLTDLRARLRRWSDDNADVLRDAKPVMPEGFDNRRADNWRVQLAIAELAGEDWAEKARIAAANLDKESDATTIGVRLLAHIQRIRDEVGGDCVLSAALVARLKEDPEAPWAEWNRGKGLTQNSLAALLGGGGGRGRRGKRGYGIHSQTVHPPGQSHGRGYRWAQFEDAWSRYLTPDTKGVSSGDE
jgi:Protein of unknown function (DUF3631)